MDKRKSGKFSAVSSASQSIRSYYRVQTPSMTKESATISEDKKSKKNQKKPLKKKKKLQKRSGSRLKTENKSK